MKGMPLLALRWPSAQLSLGKPSKKLARCLGLALASTATKRAWKPIGGIFHKEGKPRWVLQPKASGKHHLCGCKLCFFCKSELACGATHGKLAAHPKMLLPCHRERKRIEGPQHQHMMC